MTEEKLKLAIIGASYLQEPLIETAKKMGYETHVFAWQAGDIGESTADFFYPISIVEKEAILDKCREIGIAGICTIASDLAAITVNYVAYEMGLTCNSPECSLLSTNKHAMREAFVSNGDPSPRSIYVKNVDDLKDIQLAYPIIVKPLDRSGSRGITKLSNGEKLAEAIEAAKCQGFEKAALVEEFAEGDEYSVEYISYKGEHHFLAMTKKYTTGAPHFIETAHMEPAPVGEICLNRVKCVVEHALDSLHIENGASHSELKVAADGSIKIIEIGGRMGGDFIGSHLVRYSTGIDFVGNVIRIAVGEEPDFSCEDKANYAGVRFVFGEEDLNAYKELKEQFPDSIIYSDIDDSLTAEDMSAEVTDSSNRFGAYVYIMDRREDMERFLP